MQICADEYNGKVRFGIIDQMEEEMLKFTFKVYTLPQQFYIKDGTAYEMKGFTFFYDNIRAFIEGDYLTEENVHRVFPAPRAVYNKFTIYFAYALKDGMKAWYNNMGSIREIMS